MNKQIQTCCICLNNLSNVKDTHHFSCCAGAMHQACYSLFCGTLFSSHCPYCRRAHHRSWTCQKIENKSKYASRIPIDMNIDEAANLYDLNVLDFM